MQLFAGARDAAGSDRVTVELPAGARVGDLKTELGARFPKLAALAPRLLVAVGHEYADERVPLTPQSEIACFPPVSGG